MSRTTTLHQAEKSCRVSVGSLLSDYHCFLIHRYHKNTGKNLLFLLSLWEIEVATFLFSWSQSFLQFSSKRDQWIPLKCRGSFARFQNMFWCSGKLLSSGSRRAEDVTAGTGIVNLLVEETQPGIYWTWACSSLQINISKRKLVAPHCCRIIFTIILLNSWSGVENTSQSFQEMEAQRCWNLQSAPLTISLFQPSQLLSLHQWLRVAEGTREECIYIYVHLWP